MRVFILALTILCFFVTSVIGTFPVYAQEFRLPTPGVMVRLSPEYNPPILKGIKVHPDNPFRFEFILDQGDDANSSGDAAKQFQQEQLKQQATRLVKYFLASLTIPEKDLWVNLSPYEKNRIVPQSFGRTEMGRDLLAEDYMLKQITASLIYPEDRVGKLFWKRIYEEAQKKFGTTNIPVNTFNKVWIVPDKTVVYENTKAGTAYITESTLKVMLEQDYLSLQKHSVGAQFITPPNNVNALGSQIVREIVIPELTKEVNEDKNFAQLRQVYNSLILATWYKKKIKESILAQMYADKKKVAGVEYNTSVILSEAKDLNKLKDSSPSAQNDTELIYQRYLQAFKKGAYNYIKEDLDPSTHDMVPRKYFSGGTNLALPYMKVFETAHFAQKVGENQKDLQLTVNLAMQTSQNQNVKVRHANFPYGNFITGRFDSHGYLTISIDRNLGYLPANHHTALSQILIDVVGVSEKILNAEGATFDGIRLIFDSPYLVQEQNDGSARWEPPVEALLNSLNVLDINKEFHKSSFTLRAYRFLSKFVYRNEWRLPSNKWSGRFGLDISSPIKRHLLSSRVKDYLDSKQGAAFVGAGSNSGNVKLLSNTMLTPAYEAITDKRGKISFLLQHQLNNNLTVLNMAVQMLNGVNPDDYAAQIKLMGSLVGPLEKKVNEMRAFLGAFNTQQLGQFFIATYRDTKGDTRRLFATHDTSGYKNVDGIVLSAEDLADLEKTANFNEIYNTLHPICVGLQSSIAAVKERIREGVLDSRIHEQVIVLSDLTQGFERKLGEVQSSLLSSPGTSSVPGNAEGSAQSVKQASHAMSIYIRGIHRFLETELAGNKEYNVLTIGEGMEPEYAVIAANKENVKRVTYVDKGDQFMWNPAGELNSLIDSQIESIRDFLKSVGLMSSSGNPKVIQQEHHEVEAVFPNRVEEGKRYNVVICPNVFDQPTIFEEHGEGILKAIANAMEDETNLYITTYNSGRDESIQHRGQTADRDRLNQIKDILNGIGIDVVGDVSLPGYHQLIYKLSLRTRAGNHGPGSGTQSAAKEPGKSHAMTTPKVVFLDLDGTLIKGADNLRAFMYGRLYDAMKKRINVKDPTQWGEETVKVGLRKLDQRHHDLLLLQRNVDSKLLTSIGLIRALRKKVEEEKKKEGESHPELEYTDPEYLNFYNQVFKEYVLGGSIVAFLPGAEQLLKDLKPKRGPDGVKVYAVTLGMRDDVERIFDVLGITDEKYFDGVYAPTLETEKTFLKGDEFKRVLNDLGFLPQNARVVGDNQLDIDAAKAAGIEGMIVVAHEILETERPQGVIITPMADVFNKLWSLEPQAVIPEEIHQEATSEEAPQPKPIIEVIDNGRKFEADISPDEHPDKIGLDFYEDIGGGDWKHVGSIYTNLGEGYQRVGNSIQGIEIAKRVRDNGRGAVMEIGKMMVRALIESDKYREVVDSLDQNSRDVVLMKILIDLGFKPPAGIRPNAYYLDRDEDLSPLERDRLGLEEKTDVKGKRIFIFRNDIDHLVTTAFRDQCIVLTKNKQLIFIAGKRRVTELYLGQELKRIETMNGGGAHQAMKASNGQENTGGIDLTPARMNLQTKVGDSRFHRNDRGMLVQNDRGIKFHLDPALLAQLQNASGFKPVIIKIQPLKDLESFLD